jgi:hypothetical protein
VADLLGLRVHAATLMGRGESWERVEAEVIGSSELDSDQKAALWLYGWSFLGQQEQRAEAERYLALVGDRPDGGVGRNVRLGRVPAQARQDPRAARSRRGESCTRR